MADVTDVELFEIEIALRLWRNARDRWGEDSNEAFVARSEAVELLAFDEMREALRGLIDAWDQPSVIAGPLSEAFEKARRVLDGAST